MTTMTHDSEFDLDRFVVYLEKLRINRPRAAIERLPAEGTEQRIAVRGAVTETIQAEPGK